VSKKGTDSRILAIIDEIIANEGGFVNHKNDRGGATNYGITIGTLSNYLGKPATVDDVKNMPRSLAVEIYETRFYYKPRIHTLVDDIELHLFDIGVNCAPRRAIKMAQTVANKSGLASLKVDGVIGINTATALEKTYKAMGGYFHNALADERKMYYDIIVARRPQNEVFYKGWINRTNKYRVKV
jgi:lysozyme family protein